MLLLGRQSVGLRCRGGGPYWIGSSAIESTRVKASRMTVVMAMSMTGKNSGVGRLEDLRVEQIGIRVAGIDDHTECGLPIGFDGKEDVFCVRIWEVNEGNG